ncbi:hypothetical protein GCM10020256_15210 [Streptomyces thermocoprophilus]
MPVARALVRDALTEAEHGADRDTAELLTAELVANAVEHTSGSSPPSSWWWSCCRAAARSRCTIRTRSRPVI